MFYREAGQFKTSYQADSAIFPILQDKVFIFANSQHKRAAKSSSKN